MAERAAMKLVPKPWGRVDLGPWIKNQTRGAAIGEIWYERPRADADSSLLLKLLFTTQALSIQVHPDDAFARSLGMPRGKSEAWYILSADAEAKVGVGLTRRVSAAELRAAVEDGSIEKLVNWLPVKAGDVISVPAGTIHAIGAGIVLAEVQQTSDATFRLFDYGRGRELHIDRMMAMVDPAAPARGLEPDQKRLCDARRPLLSCPYFTVETLHLPPLARTSLHAGPETWLLTLEGDASFQGVKIITGEAIFLEHEWTGIAAGAHGLKALVAYASAHVAVDLLDGVRSSTAGGFSPPLNTGEAISGAWILNSETHA
jgi:mannose-6-phosphate isomerase